MEGDHKWWWVDGDGRKGDGSSSGGWFWFSETVVVYKIFLGSMNRNGKQVYFEVNFINRGHSSYIYLDIWSDPTNLLLVYLQYIKFVFMVAILF